MNLNGFVHSSSSQAGPSLCHGTICSYPRERITIIRGYVLVTLLGDYVLVETYDLGIRLWIEETFATVGLIWARLKQAPRLVSPKTLRT